MTSVPTQIVQYECDSLEVSYSDGALLQLSPCAACFVYHQPRDDSHPVYGDRVIQQRTPYTISTFRDKVQNALEFRNRFATQPYVCKEVLHRESLVRLHGDLVEFQWPLDVTSTDITKLDDGSLQLSDLHQHATVTLAACLQLLTVRYLCKVGRVSQQRKIETLKSSSVNPGNPLSDLSQTSAMNSTSCQNETVLSEAAILNEGLWDYSWLTRQFSMLSVPECWQHPCQLLTQFAKKNTNSVHFEDQRTLNEEETGKCDNNDEKRPFVSTLIPQALPLNCRSLNLHKWNNQSEGSVSGLGRLKVTSSHGVIYRVIDTSSVCVEIYPGDGSIMRSQGLAGHYFTHYIYNSGKVEERIHSVLHPPPDTPGSLYSISKLICRGSRLLQHVCDQSVNLLRTSSPVCWQVDGSQSAFREALSAVILEQCTVSGVGKFTAYSSGRIHIVFDDRTTLDMITDWSSRICQYLKHKNADNEVIDIQYYKNQLVPAHCSDVPRNACRLLLPSGYYQYVDVNTPGHYQRYIQAALEWVNWVNTSSADRLAFYKDTVHDEVRLNSVQEEMTKIRCFNYIIENTVMSQFSHAKDQPDREQNNYRMMENTLLDRISGIDLRHQSAAGTATAATDMAAQVSSLNRAMAANLVGKTAKEGNYCGSLSVDGSTLGQSEYISQVNKDELSHQVVQDVLLKTSEKIKELDSFLNNQRKRAVMEET